MASPLRLSLKYIGLYGTGFAYPKTGPPRESSSNGMRTVPNGSTCFRGFKLSLPQFFAVGSPSLEAAKP